MTNKTKIIASLTILAIIITGVGWVFVNDYSKAQTAVPISEINATTTPATNTDILINPKAELNNLRSKTGSDFDKNFLLQMMLYHQMMIAISQMAPTNSDNSDIKAFASEEINQGQMKINKMIQWYQQWFGMP